ncbi:4'-phosphopantetheinyl transferase family protein [Orrella marina]|uniref:Enterobactin synthase component D n=1 Tax=Orrella marina TaxID=2163011 RepID=A0A2R4XK84_9BURK|nr:4'-phosphopantetheinyl transferase superfamily protein [Orrella marina]AWB34174.1 phosphopantetheinyl transferase [Orrella marina]
MTAWILGLADLLELSPDIRLSGLALPTSRTSMDVLVHAPTSWLGQSMVTGMSHKRRTEFLAGRLCAFHSLSEMGVDAEFPLPVQDRLPIWPPGILGSISHCASVAVAMAAPATRFHAVGIDVEMLIDAEIAQDIRHSVGRDRELECLERNIPCRARSLTLLFSAKEALYKALYPFSRQYKDFHAAEIVSCQANALVLRLTEDWCGSWRGGACVEVRYAWMDREVLTAVCIPRVSSIHSRITLAAITQPEV